MSKTERTLFVQNADYYFNLKPHLKESLEKYYKLVPANEAEYILHTDFKVAHKLLYPKAKYLITNTTGDSHINRIDFEKVYTLRTSTNSHLKRISSTAEWALFLMFKLLRGTSYEYDWLDREKNCGHSIAYKHMLIVGMGRIGTKIFNAIDSLKECFPPWGIDKNTQLMRQKTLIKNADIIFLCLDLNPTTQNWFNEEKIDWIPKSKKPYLINISRGEIIDEDALLRNIDKFKGVALDVLCGEPKPKNFNNFLKCPNVIITPHMGGNTYEAKQQSIRLAEGILIRLATIGKPHTELGRRRRRPRLFTHKIIEEDNSYGSGY